MARIFIAFYNGVDLNVVSNLPCFYESFIRGLQDSGNTLMVEITNIWQFSEQKCPASIAKKIKDFNPDVCFLFNNCFYDITDLVECPIVVYEVDSFLFYKNKNVLYSNPNRFYYFIAQTCSFDILQNELHVDKNRICYVPFFTEIQAKPAQMLNNICFVGSKFTNGDANSIVRKFMLLNPNDEEKKQFKTCLELIVKNPYITIIDLEKDIGTLSQKVLSVITDPLLFGYLSDVRRIKVLTSVTDLGLNLYGTTNWINDIAYNNDLLLSYNNKKIFSLNDTENLYNSHKIGININHVQATHGFGWRVADIMASNACLVSEKHPDLLTLFHGVNLPLFDTKEEAHDLCKKLLKNENMRSDIVSACHEIIDKNFRFKHILNIMESFLSISMHQEQSKNKKTEFYYITKRKQSKATKRLKQFIYAFGLFLVSCPCLYHICPKKIQTKLKEKITRYFD